MAETVVAPVMDPILESAVRAVESAVVTNVTGKLTFTKTAKLALPDGRTLVIKVKNAKEAE